MFGIGFLELCIIAMAVLVFVGPQKLPQVMKEFGKFLVQMRRMTNEVKHSVNEAVREVDQEVSQTKEEILDPLHSIKSFTEEVSKKSPLKKN